MSIPVTPASGSRSSVAATVTPTTSEPGAGQAGAGPEA